jgi:predicted transglutaminase-like cysteine proteinase
MDIKITFTRTEEQDGVDQVLSIEESDIGDYVSDVLRPVLSALQAAGYSYLEELSASNVDGDVFSTDTVVTRSSYKESMFT